ncbi:hypothetical protein [Streptomyces sp. Ru62]|uniref:hypothetical protein n=1 Tax=Streptomyces sp. Ru62 TaxID=2080745 RepID=UPI0015E3F050|nr:hypothetical protein [Streptomyces sp. Ru62]
MEIILTIREPSDEFQRDLLALLDKHADRVRMDTDWNVERAARFCEELPTRARRIIKGVVAGQGFVSAEELRATPGGSLRGHAGAMKQTLERGARLGWWPDGLRAPVVPVGPGFGKVQGYRMPPELLKVFATALSVEGQAPGPGDRSASVD